MGVHQIRATRKDGAIGSFILFYVNWKRKGLAAAFGHSRSFTAALIGGKLDSPVFLRSERRKAGNCSFTAVPIGGKVDFPAFLLFLGEENYKSHVVEIFRSDFYTFFPSFACWGVMGRGLAPQNEGWTCVNNNWEK
ncbi:hypothetical protein AAC387_Pa02g4055 [Persea americana]